MNSNVGEKRKQIEIFQTARDLVAHLDSLPKPGTLGIVMTMGALHDGHGALVRQCVSENDVCMVTLFVNPLQFGAHEDLSTYPRTEERDKELFEKWGASILFAPKVEEVYPASFDTHILCGAGNPERNELSEGAFRPIFFRGVATVVAKTLSLSRADRCYFGLKDAQQCAVVKRVVNDLWLRCEVRLVETQREEDGLAMSSRNAYLTEEQRRVANTLWKALCCAKEIWNGGVRDIETLRQTVRGEIEQNHMFQLMYVSICDRWTMREMKGELSRQQGALVLCVAAMLGKARLIDNIVLAE